MLHGEKCGNICWRRTNVFCKRTKGRKWKTIEDIFPFKEKTKGQNITFIIQMDDEPGLLSAVLKMIARFHGNILTIHQSIPMNGVASLTLSVAISAAQGDAAAMVEHIQQIEGVHYLKILGRE